MLLGISSHAIRERCARVLDQGAINELPLIEEVHLFNEFGGMAVAILHGLETSLILCLVATQDEDVLNAQKLKVEQHILNILFRHATHHHMRHHLDAIFLHDGTCHRNRTGTATHEMTEISAIGLLHIHILTAVSRDVDVFGTKLFQCINRAEKSRRACPLHWWQHLKGEGSLFVLID